MKRLITFVLAVFISCAAFAQTRNYKYPLTPFTAISAGNDFQVALTAGDAFGARLTVDEILKPYVVCAVKGNTLTLSFQEKQLPADIKKLYKGRKGAAPTFSVVITLPAAAGITHIGLSGKAVLREGDATFSAPVLTIDATDNAVIRGLNFQSRNISVNLARKASAALSLECDQLDITMNGASLLLTQKAKNTELNLLGGASAIVKGETKALTVTAKGNVECSIDGTAEKAEYLCSGAGSAKVDASTLVCEDATISMENGSVLKQAASKRIQLNLSGGANLYFGNDPTIAIDQIRNASVNRLSK